MEKNLALHHQNPQETERYQAASHSTWISIFVNCLLTCGQIMVGWLACSQSLIADGVHSLSDLVADVVVLAANRQSKKAADDDHQYGHYRYENAASLALGVLLLAVGIGMLWTSIHKLQNPESIAQVQSIALWVAGAALISKELLFRYMLHVAQKIRSSLLIANAWHARSDAASSLIVAVGIIGNLLGYKLLDPIAALVVGVMIARMGYSFTWDSLHDLMDRATDTETETKIRQDLLATPGVAGLHDLKTRKMGDLIVVDVHLEIDGALSVRDGHDIAVAARKTVLAKHPVLNVMTHVDPVDLALVRNARTV